MANPALALFDARGVLVWDASGWSRAVQDEARAQVEGLLGLRAVPATVATGHAPEHKALLSYNLGRTFLRQSNEGKARSLFESAVASDEAWSDPRTLLGHLLLEQPGDRGIVQAEAHFRAAVEIDPGDISALTGLGEALLRMDRVDEAAAILDKALTLDATFTPAVAGRARTLARQGRPAEALTLFAAALELNPRDAAIYAGRAACRELTGDVGAAAADYRLAVEIMIGAR